MSQRHLFFSLKRWLRRSLPLGQCPLHHHGRGGQLYVFADVDSQITPSEGVHVIRLPEHYSMLSPILHGMALQLLDYHTALARGADVDKPRNLAKSVTVTIE